MKSPVNTKKPQEWLKLAVYDMKTAEALSARIFSEGAKSQRV
jgi:hypothetical protein